MPRVRLGDGPDAMVVDLDTVEDVVKLHQALHRGPKRQPASTASVPGPKLLIPFGSPARFVFRNGQYAAFEAMCAAGAKGVGTQIIARLLGLPSPKSIPPIIAAWGKRAAKLGLKLKDELLEVERGYEHGKPSTVYRLTPKGMDVFRPETEPARTASDSGR